MANDKRRINPQEPDIGVTLSEPYRQVFAQAPAAFAVVAGVKHKLIFANAAFRTVPGIIGEAAPGRPIGDLFEATVTTRLIALLDRAMSEQSALRDRFLGPLEPGSRPWTCTVWPMLHDAELSQALVIELSVATRTEVALSLQREVAERLLLSGLRQSEAAEGAEASHQRSTFLATASRHLAESLDTEITRTAVSGLTLPTLAAWCIVDLLAADDTMQRLTIVHRDARKQALVSQLDGRWSPQNGDPFGVPAVLRDAQPVLIAENVDEALGRAAHDPEDLRVLRDLGIGPLLTVPLIAGNRVFGAITFVSAVRDRAFTEEDIQLAEGLAARSSLALENARLYGAALMLKDKAEAAAKTATKFLGTISHELRTPLNAIFGYVEVLALGIHGPITDAQRGDLDRITTNQRHLLVLIGELLNFLRLGSGRVLYDAVEVVLEEAATHAVEVLEPIIAKKGLVSRIVADGSKIGASADADSVHQILVNLISNAIKFTNDGGEISVTCSAEDGNVAITVTDSGRGIAPEKLEAIFEPFVQAYDDDSKKYGGIGLGLAISRDLARAMQGDLTVESKLGASSSFKLTLPAYGV